MAPRQAWKARLLLSGVESFTDSFTWTHFTANLHNAPQLIEWLTHMHNLLTHRSA